MRATATLLVLLALAGCMSATDRADAVRDQLAVGDLLAAEAAVQVGVQAHPDDVDLLVLAAELYLHTTPEQLWKPRLALHYAMRADQAAAHQDKRATRLLVQAYRATGGSPLGDELVRRGLEEVGHRDARAPKRLAAADVDLLEPTGANLREQARRERARAAGEEPCAADWVHVPAGRYPVSDAEVAEAAAFCVRASGQSVDCGGARVCSSIEVAIACTALGAVLGDDPSCAGSTTRCCAAPAESP